MTDRQTSAQRNRELVERHFDAFVNRRDLSAIDRNVAADFLDHDGPGGAPAGRDVDRAMMAGMHQRFPDLRITLEDVVAAEDKVVVRAIWTGTDAVSGKSMQMRGLVLWRIADNLLAERWATVTPMTEAGSEGNAW